MKPRSLPLLAGVVLAATIVAGASQAQSVSRLKQCSSGTATLRFSVTYVEQGQGKNVTKQLDMDLEANRNSGFKAGQKVTFLIDGKKVKSTGFVADRNGDLDADIKVTSKSGKDFPRVKDGSKASAEVRNGTVAICVL